MHWPKRKFTKDSFLKTSSNTDNNKLWIPIYTWTHPIWPLWFSFLCDGFRVGGKTHKFCRGPFNEYSYQVWFQFTQWLQRGRMKCKSLRTMTNRHNMTKSHMNHWVRGELKKKRKKKSHLCKFIMNKLYMMYQAYWWMCITFFHKYKSTNASLFFCKNIFLSPRQYTKPNLMSFIYSWT